MKEKFIQFVKKDNLLGTLLILFLLVFILSWLVVPGRYMEGIYQSAEAIKPIGLFDLISIPILTFVRAIHVGFFVLMVGGFYGILNQISTYQALVKNMAKRLSDKVVIIVSLFFVALSGFTGNMYLLFLIAPFFMAVIMVAKYDKITAFAATIGAILVGSVFAPFHSLFLASFSHYYNYDYAIDLLMKITVFWIIGAIYIFWIDRKKKTVRKEEIPLYKANKQKSAKDLNYIFSFVSLVFFIFLAVVMFDWHHALGIETVREFSMQLKDDSFIGLLLGRFEQFGYWGSYDLIVLMIVYLLLFIYIFQVSWQKVGEGFLWGVKQVLKPAVYMLLTLIFYYVITNIQGPDNIFQTFVYYILNITGDNNVIGLAGVSLLGTLFYVNVPELVSVMTNIITIVDINMEPILLTVMQMFYALGLLFVPTSLFLVGGLVLLKIPYFAWLQYIYKILLVLTAVGVVFITIMAVV